MGAWIEIKGNLRRSCIGRVAPLVGAWIEISAAGSSRTTRNVAPLVGAWIEISISLIAFSSPFTASLPSWERGLKSLEEYQESMKGIVAPLVGAWIEISCRKPPFDCCASLPSWERGLKSG